MVNTKSIKRFRGLNNVDDPLRLGLAWLERADNVDITATGAIARRDGFLRRASGAFTGAYTTLDFARFYVVDGGVLKQVMPDMTTVALRDGLSPAPMHWTEANNQVYYSNGTDFGIIRPDGRVCDWAWPAPTAPDVQAVSGRLPAGTYGVACTFLLPDGRETGAEDAAFIRLEDGQALQITGIPQVNGLTTQVYIAPADSTVLSLAFETDQASATWNGSADELGVDLVTQFLDPPPAGATMPTFWRGRMYLMQYVPSADATVVWYSRPLAFHLFDLDEGFFMAPGRGTLLAPHDDGLIVGTDSKVYAYDGDNLNQIAEYGAVPGWSWVLDETEDDQRQILFWSTRGLCSALPLSNLTLKKISVNSGVRAGAAILRKDGAKRYVVALQKGGDNFNQRG